MLSLTLLHQAWEEKSYEIFKVTHFIVTWIYVFAAVSFYYVSFPFIELWMGKDFVLDGITVFVY